MEISFIVPGDPVAKARPMKNKGRSYKDPRGKSYEHAVGIFALQEMRRCGFALTNGPVMLSVVFTMKTPKTGKTYGDHHISRPDSSNLLKSIEDGMVGIVYKDDCQVCHTFTSKVYGKSPNAHVTVRTI